MRACEFFFATPQIRAPDIFIEHAHIFENKKEIKFSDLFQRK